MQKLNESIHTMSESEFDCPFMDGTKMKSRKRVETLKNASRDAEIKARFAQVRLREADARDKKQELTEREVAANQREVAIKKVWETVSKEREQIIKSAAELQEKQEKVKTAINELKTAYMQIVSEIDKWYKGLTDKAELARIIGEKPLTQQEQKQVADYKPVKRAMAQIIKTVVNEAEKEIDRNFPVNAPIKKQKSKEFTPDF